MSDDDATEEARKIKEAKEVLRKSRRFTRQDAPPELTAAECSTDFWPSKAQFKRWSMYVLWDMGVTPDGWWYGRCPGHDPMGDGEASALISFSAGSLRCLGEGDDSCHPNKRGISLVNALDVAVRKLVGTDAEVN